MSLYQIFDHVVGFQLFFFGLILVLYQKKLPANHLLAIFIFAKTMIYVRYLIIHYHGNPYILNLPAIRWFFYGFYFLLAPSILLYAKSILLPDFNLSVKDILLLIVYFVLGASIIFFINILLNNSEGYSGLKIIRVTFKLLFSLFFFILTIKTAFHHHSGENQNLNAKNKRYWLKIVSISLTALWILENLPFYIQFFTGYKIENAFVYIESLFFLVLISLMFISFKFRNAFHKEPIIEKYKYSDLTIDHKKKIISALDKHMTMEMSYLNPEMSLDELSNILKINTRDLSQSINEILGVNFKECINNYRIEYSITLLENPEHNHKTILEILYESGFNSKSNFNNLFFKRTGLTPTNYRKKKLS